MSESDSRVEPAIPERIGRYDVLVPLGTGGMATVYLARAEVVPGVPREYALKLMHAHLRGDPEWATHLLDEARIAARVRHPNVVQVVEAGDDPLGLFLVLEYVEGDTLSGLSRAVRRLDRELPLPVSGRILIDALTGLNAAHESLGLVHRDFSPQNILVGIDGVGRLTDFGIAKAPGGQVTATGMLKGKVSYMSPEQARGQRVDQRCDVWAAGVIAWELLAGRRLFPNRNDTETLLAVVSSTPSHLRDVKPEIPEALDAVVAHALTPDLDHRCPDVKSFRERLGAGLREYCGLAEQSEVGDFVREVVKPTLERRERQIRRRLDATAAPEPITPSKVSGDSLVVAEPEGVTAFQLVTSARRRRAVAVGAGGVLLFLGILGGALFISRAHWFASEPSIEASSAIAPAPAASASAPEPTGEPLTSLLVRANKKIKRVRIGRRSVEIEAPSDEVEVVLEANERGTPLSLEVTSETGANVKADVGAKDGSVTVHFADGARVPAKPARTGDELAPTPFKSK